MNPLYNLAFRLDPLKDRQSLRVNICVSHTNSLGILNLLGRVYWGALSEVGGTPYFLKVDSISG